MSTANFQQRIQEKENNLPNFSWGDLVRAYWFLLDKTRGRWFFYMLCLFALSFYALVPPFILGRTVDFFAAYQAGGPLTLFYLYTAILGTSFVVVSFLRLTLKRTIGNLQSEVMYQIKVRGFEKLLDFSLSWHLEESAGAKAQRIRSGVESYRILNHSLNNEIMRSVSSIIGVIVVSLFLRPQYVILFLLYILGFCLILRTFYKKIEKQNDLYFSSLEKAGGSYVEGLSNILTIKTLGADPDFKKHIAAREHKTKEHEFTIRKLSNSLWKTFQAFNGISYGLFLFIVGQDIVRGQISPGSLVIFYGYLQGLIGNAADMMDTYEITLSSKSGIGRMMSIFRAKTGAVAGNKMLPANWDKIILKDARFTYTHSEDDKTKKKLPALHNISLSIPRAAKIGVVGQTGSGKSTLAKLLAGLYPFSSGEYRIGDTSFYELAHEEQTKQITLVLQETEVFNLSLGDNITLMRDIEPELLLEALSIAQLDDVVAKLPDGLDTLVGEKGYHLSGGERQRMGIARAICKNSPIMIFDEATSSLDSKTELLIQEALETKLQEKTVIIIAHRVSTLQKTDIIYVFEDGVIVEQGTFSDLSNDKGSKFHELYQVQQYTA